MPPRGSHAVGCVKGDTGGGGKRQRAWCRGHGDCQEADFPARSSGDEKNIAFKSGDLNEQRQSNEYTLAAGSW